MTFPLLQQIAPRHGLTARFSWTTKAVALTAITLLSLPIAPAQAAGPGRGQTAQFERDYLTQYS